MKVSSDHPGIHSDWRICSDEPRIHSLELTLGLSRIENLLWNGLEWFAIEQIQISESVWIVCSGSDSDRCLIDNDVTILTEWVGFQSDGARYQKWTGFVRVYTTSTTHPNGHFETVGGHFAQCSGEKNHLRKLCLQTMKKSLFTYFSSFQGSHGIRIWWNEIFTASLDAVKTARFRWPRDLNRDRQSIEGERRGKVNSCGVGSILY